MKLCVFLIGSRRCALPVAAVREVVRLGSWSRVPHPSGRVGLAVLRGKVLTLVDRSRELGAGPAPDGVASWAVLLELSGRDVALLVDSMPVIEVVAAAAAAPPGNLPADLSNLLRGVLLEPGSPVHLLEASAVAAP